MRIASIVEGHGEMTAAPELIRQVAWRLGRYEVVALPGYRVARSEFSEPTTLAKIIEAVAIQYRPDGILIVFDADDDCPSELAGRLFPVCEAAPVNTQLVVANREYEAWFLAAASSLRTCSGVREDAQDHPDPEAPRNAKGQVENQMTERYTETLHQTKFTAALDLDLACQNSRSFRRLHHAMEQLLGIA